VTISVTNVDLRGDEPATEGRIGSYVCITVSDTGIGMTEQVRLRAFDPFFTTKEPGRGSGLGLSQVYGLVKESGGMIHLESQPTAGTTVSIYLPRATGPVILPGADRERDVTAAATVAAPSRKGRRIVLVDDDEQARSAVTDLLVAAGYTVASFATAREALDEIDGPQRIDLCIVDYAMPTIRGDQFAAEVRSRRPDVPVLFITGYAETEPLQSERWVLRKPFRGTALIAAIEGAMRIAA